jgi:hypothetical protein
MVGILFTAPNPSRTRLALFVCGLDREGFLRAAWSVPFRTGLTVPDYMVLGTGYGGPANGWTLSKGPDSILAAGYWGNEWEYDGHCGYLT